MKYFKIIAVFTCCLLTLSFVQAQDRADCVTERYMQRKIQTIPGLQTQITRIIEEVTTWVRNHPYDPYLHQIPVTIPVVVHVLHRNDAEKVSEAVIRDQIALTNEHLRRAAPNYSSVPAPFQRLAANCRVQLQLAARDPQGRATNGIKYYTVTKAVYDPDLDDAKKRGQGGANPWNTLKYLNIWVCNVKDACGYATFPYLYGTTAAVPDSLQGVVVDRGCFGRTGFKNGTSLTHELGHFLGLKHIWGDADCGNDDVDDTPQQKANNSGCPTYPKASTCTGSAPDGEMFFNLMDYTTCRAIFTRGQAQKAWGFLNYYQRRASLLSSDALVPPTGRPRSYMVEFIPEYETLPSWKAALAMVHGFVVSACIPIDEINRLTTAARAPRASRYATLPPEVADAIFGLGLTVEEMLICYSAGGFYNNVLNQGPVALIEISGTSIYGLVISGMHLAGATAVVEVQDPMNAGPRQFAVAVQQDGTQKIVNYPDLLTHLNSALLAGKKIYIARPPRP